jgi:hypothetical protein
MRKVLLVYYPHAFKYLLYFLRPNMFKYYHCFPRRGGEYSCLGKTNYCPFKACEVVMENDYKHTEDDRLEEYGGLYRRISRKS